MAGDILEDKDSNGNLSVFNLLFDAPFSPGVSDYMLVYMVATNTGGVAYPFGSFSVNLGSYSIEATAPQENAKESGYATGDRGTDFDIYERTKFYIDGLRHKYYIPLGENKFYRYGYGGGNFALKEDIKNLVIEIPQINGVFINIEKIEIKKRTFFALDSHINYLLKNYFNISHINRYMTPAYIFILFILILFLTNRLLIFFKHDKNLCFSTGKNLHPSNNKSPVRPVISALLVISVLSVFYFMATNTFYTVKSYRDSYKKYILAGNLDEAYYGFYDFEKFIFWVDEMVPPGEDLVVLLKGEPVYIMAEMAYNLYPRDIRFLNVSGKEENDIISEINELNNQAKFDKEGYCKDELKSYKYIVILSDEDKIASDNLKFLSNYKKTGGFIYRLK